MAERVEVELTTAPRHKQELTRRRLHTTDRSAEHTTVILLLHFRTSTSISVLSEELTMLARSVCSARAVRFSCSHSSSTSVAQGGCVGSSASGGTREAFTLSTMSGKPQIVRLLTLGDSGM